MTDTRPTIRDLCHQWKIVSARRDLDMLERDRDQDDDDTVDRLMDEALEQFRAVEQAILDTPTSSITDADFVAIIDLFRHVDGNHEYANEQEERCNDMLVLIRETIIDRRFPPRRVAA